MILQYYISIIIIFCYDTTRDDDGDNEGQRDARMYKYIIVIYAQEFIIFSLSLSLLLLLLLHDDDAHILYNNRNYVRLHNIIICTTIIIIREFHVHLLWRDGATIYLCTYYARYIIWYLYTHTHTLYIILFKIVYIVVSLQPWPDVYDMAGSMPCAAQTAVIMIIII